MDFKVRLIGDPVLRKKAKPVEKIDDKFREFLEEMAEMMYREDGVGLAAPQIGISRRFFVMDDGNKLRKVINPEIIKFLGEEVSFEEGCLSIPKIFLNVKRPEGIIVKYTNENGEIVEEELHEYTARIFQHEYDHLEGKLFIDRVGLAAKAKVKSKINELMKEGRKIAKELGEVDLP
ncbi:peptide deformylase [Marinitoga sp. 1135]|uniref:Peptide deformylase n=1 Tax=Marinitoga piezophila (strain DSM 14283 / JCM 11233 / KA3) TaxID=443254 RepID=H2J6F4_MARPK|nr:MULTISPECIES: peptide deformylase [Marinitoga]AEX85139.1 peptide deformylase [Marinitoga piezophila KA3]APT75639.1 peptide deformylase [Marinitoga sp. 1137]NUU95347.1 peptide deformylase [Marinitoga sp. 1135]NUU97281.1 peptide deformylase [Marinitoga sp. 1138]